MSEQEQTRKKSSTTSSPAFTARSSLIQRKCACGGSAGVDGECAECRGKRLSVQRSSDMQSAPTSVPPVVHDVLSSPGQPLDSDTRAYMEPRFEHDFSQVRVHADGKAAESAQAINALAYTAGRDIAFGEGQYVPETTEGKKLLAHELTHVVQQGEHSQITANKLGVGQPGGIYEREAERMSVTVSDDQVISLNPVLHSEIRLQRQTPMVDAAEVEIPEERNAPESKTTETKSPETKALRSLTDNEAVREIIGKFPAFIQNQIGNIENQKEFLRVMPRYLGPDPNTENHFKVGEVRPAGVPGHPWLHRSAAEHLEAVKRDLGDAMPDTDVGLAYGIVFMLIHAIQRAKWLIP